MESLGQCKKSPKIKEKKDERELGWSVTGFKSSFLEKIMKER